MGNELKKDIKKLLLLDSLLSSTCSISRILDEVEKELEDIFGESKKDCKCIEEQLKCKICK
jgi:hypothetical protein